MWHEFDNNFTDAIWMGSELRQRTFQDASEFKKQVGKSSHH
jgi:hypothetical protein